MVLASCVAVLAIAVGDRTGADFSSSTVNPGNSFSAADSFATAATDAIVAKSTTVATSYPATVLAATPLAYWRFGEAAAATTMIDASGNGHELDYFASGHPQSGEPGAVGDGNTAIRWTGGAKGPLDPEYPTGIDLSGSFSIEFWGRVESVDTGNASARVFMEIGPTELQYTQAGAIQLERSGIVRAATNIGAMTATYRHFAVTYDGTTVSWYVDGFLNTATTVTLPAGAATSLQFVPSGLPAGTEAVTLDEAAVFGTSLYSEVVGAHATAGRMLAVGVCDQYRVYASVPDHGSPPTGISSVTADLGAVTAGAGAVALTAGSYTVNGITYGYRSAPLRPGVQPGSYSYSVTSTDAAGTHVQDGLTVVIGSPVPVAPAWVTGFEAGVIATPDVFSTNLGGTVDASVFRSGSSSLKVAKTSSTSAYVMKAGITNATSLSFAIRFPTLPTANVTSLLEFDMETGSSVYLGYTASSQKLTFHGNPATTPVVAGTWHTIDLKYDQSVAPKVFSWRFDGVRQNGLTSSSAAIPVVGLRFGSVTPADVFTANFDDIALSASAFDFPLGSVRVLPLRPSGVGTHDTPGHFQQEDGSAVSSSTHLRLDDPAMTAITDGVRQVTASSTSYLEFGMADATEPCVQGVQAVVGQHKTASQANNGKASVYSGSTERVVWNGDSTANGSVAVKTALVAPVAAPWTTVELNALLFRIGYSTDVSPQPYWDALLLEYATAG